jgi:hypothetical protein
LILFLTGKNALAEGEGGERLRHPPRRCPYQEREVDFA